MTRLASCEDTDECAAGSHTCHPQAHCTNTEGSYTCVCGDRAGCSTGMKIFIIYYFRATPSLIIGNIGITLLAKSIDIS